jgi:hypothetical protein
VNKGLLTVAALFASAGLSLAQEVAMPSDSAPPVNCLRVWAKTEYLLWWLKDAPLSVPIATRGSLLDAVPGALGQPGTQVISPGRLDYAPFNGGRVTLGSWLNCDNTLGIEGSGFLLERGSARFVSNGPPGAPAVFVPFVSADPTIGFGEQAIPFGAFGATNGTVTVINKTRLWGCEINALFNLGSGEAFSLVALGGFRYLDLEESLGIDLLGNFPSGAPFTSLRTVDRFGARNQFYGGQLGLRGETRMGQFFASFTGQLAVGDMAETATTTGVAIQAPAGPVRGGFFVQNSNFGRLSADRLALIPQLDFQAGMDVTERIRVHVGYDFLYVSDVVRPGDQIDRRINFTQQPAPVAGGALMGAPLPAPQFRQSDFWAHGISLGLTLRF